MNEYFYHNIFETKGIEYILTLFFFLLIIPFWMLLNRPFRVRQLMARVGSAFNTILEQIPSGVYLDKTYTWAFMEKSGKANIGLNNFILSMAGKADVSVEKQQGDHINKGDLLASLNYKGKSLKIFSPISGEIDQINLSVLQNSEELKKDPYGKGWLLKMNPEKWNEEVQSFYLADQAVNWVKSEYNRFREFLINSTQKYMPQTENLVLQDGGELSEDSLLEMPEEIWNDFQKEFLDKTS